MFINVSRRGGKTKPNGGGDELWLARNCDRLNRGNDHTLLTHLIVHCKDPDSNTEQNEFIEIIKRRFKYANDSFSKHSAGWSTDRGKIYILYGPPESIDSFVSQSGNSNSIKSQMFNVEKWYYSGEVFIFSDERTFGEMQLINSL